jgi:hypothetical protein
MKRETKIIAVDAKGSDTKSTDLQNQPSQPDNNTINKKLTKVIRDYYKIPIAMVISVGTYLITRTIIPDEKIAWYFVEIFAFVMSLLVLWGISAAIQTNSEIKASIFLFTLVLLMFFLIKGYNEYDDVNTANVASGSELISFPNKVSIPILGLGTHTFLLKDIGDETGAFQFPEDDYYSFKISSGDYGYKIICMDEPGNPYPGSPKLRLPNKEHLVMNIVATKANQYVRITVHQ